VLGLLLKRTLFKGKEQSHFVLELPPYRMPSLRSVWQYMWERTGSFVKNAWTLIMATSVVIWILLAIPLGGGEFANVGVGDSAFAMVSEAISPVFEPLGFGDWEASGSLITGFVAKEVVIATMAQVYEVEAVETTGTPTTFTQDIVGIGGGFVSATFDTVKSIPLIFGVNFFDEEADVGPRGLMGAVQTSFEISSDGHGALAAFAFMVFVLLYTPCMVAIAAEKQELGVKWMWVSVIGQLVLAWLAGMLIFQGGLLLGIG
jgi:ferrous iron transport protein B